ncbi:MAG: 16S rRNA (cytosine(967)-C(5))-methyltransferase RsmB, partial [Clostridia bacterium]|nr:16S rRNA (cytosine(967)-C(5))-methyltransferase RsmB [Clostridia bacterium]
RASALVYETLDRLIFIDYCIDRFARGKVSPQIRGILRLGICEAWFMDTPVSAACNESVRLAEEIGKGALKGYVNGVMRAVCRAGMEAIRLPDEPCERLSVKYSYPLWLVEQYVGLYGAEFAEAMLAYRPHGMTIRPHRPFTAEELESWLDGEGIEYSRGDLVPDAFRLERGFDVSGNALFNAGSITVQSESAMLVCRACLVQPHMTVLDACCAPGGKTAYLSMLMGGSGTIDAWELHEHRAALTRATLARLNVTNARVTVRDATQRHDDSLDKYDVALVDAPCSGLGVLGKPDIRYAKQSGAPEELARTQYALLDRCCGYVKPGGALVYSTCTIQKRENEDVVDAFLASHPNFTADGLCEALPSRLAPRVRNSTLQLFPHLDNTEGFFIARLIRKT